MQNERTNEEQTEFDEFDDEDEGAAAVGVVVDVAARATTCASPKSGPVSHDLGARPRTDAAAPDTAGWMGGAACERGRGRAADGRASERAQC